MKEANKKLTPHHRKESTVVFYEGVCLHCHAPAAIEQTNGLVPKFCQICGGAMDYSQVSLKNIPASLKVEGDPQSSHAMAGSDVQSRVRLVGTDAALKKVNRYIALLREANMLARELAQSEIELNLKMVNSEQPED